MGVQFTEADRKRLEALKEKERQAKQEERNERKRADRYCKTAFGIPAKEVKKKLDDGNYWYGRFSELNGLVERLMTVCGKEPGDFKQYVEWREQKAAEKAG